MLSMHKISLSRLGLRRKMYIAFALMAVIPVLILAYVFFMYVVPTHSSEVLRLSLVIIFTLWLSYLGYLLVREIILPSLRLAAETRKLVDGYHDTVIRIDSQDELGDLARNVSALKDRIKNYVREIQDYSERTTALHARIHRNMLTLTNLIELADMIMSRMKFQKITDHAVRMISEGMGDAVCGIYIKSDENAYVTSSFVNDIDLPVREEDLLAFMPSVEEAARETGFHEAPLGELAGKEDRENGDGDDSVRLIFHPLKKGREIFGMIVVGQERADVFPGETREMLQAFGRELLLVAMRSAQQDPGGDTDSVFRLVEPILLRAHIREEIERNASYCTPCSLMHVALDGLAEEDRTEDGSGELVRKVAEVVLRRLPYGAKAALSGHDQFIVFLPGADKGFACGLAETLCVEAREHRIAVRGHDKHFTLSVGVADSAMDGKGASELMGKAESFMDMARSSGGDIVISEVTK